MQAKKKKKGKGKKNDEGEGSKAKRAKKDAKTEAANNGDALSDPMWKEKDTKAAKETEAGDAGSSPEPKAAKAEKAGQEDETPAKGKESKTEVAKPKGKKNSPKNSNNDDLGTYEPDAKKRRVSKGAKDENEEAKRGRKPTHKRDLSPESLLKRQKRSRQCCAYKHAYTAALNSGKTEEEAREKARAETRLN